MLLGAYAAASIILIAVFKSTIETDEAWTIERELKRVLYFIWVPILGVIVPLFVGKEYVHGKGSHSHYSPILLVLLILINGSSMMFATGADPIQWWPFYLAVGVVAVICAFSLGIILAFKGEDKDYEDLRKKLKEKGTVTNVVKGLELEHSTYKTIAQVIFSFLGIFFISGVIAVAFNESILEELGDNQRLAAFIVLTSSFWGLVGIWFGIIGPILGRLKVLRERIQNFEFEERHDS